MIILIISFTLSQDFENLYFGAENDLDIITWNIEWFPKNDQITINYVTQIIEALDVDIIAMQELSDTILFNQMLNSLPEFQAYYESSWFAGLAYIYKLETIEINEIYEIYTSYPYWSPFPRSPMVMDMNFMEENYIIINNHFKCCGDGILNSDNENDEEMRRYIASSLLKQYVDTYLPNNKVIILGDLNDILTDEIDNNVFQMFLNDEQNYLFVDMETAQGNTANWSYPNWPSHIDHILITNELFNIFENDNSYNETIKIDDYMDGGFYEYDHNISDHRPVGLKLAIEYTNSGDVNGDGEINIIDVISVVNMILGEELINVSADLNQDEIINIVDVIQLVNIILN